MESLLDNRPLPYDLLVKGARILDPSQGLDRIGDMAVTDGRIAAVADSIAPTEARSCLDAQGTVLCPGLIDAHAHCYWGATRLGVEPDSAFLARGVTTVVDAGSAGSVGFSGFRRWVIDASKCRVLAFVNLSAIGLVTAGISQELASPKLFDGDGALEILRSHPDVTVGLKLRLSEYALGNSCLDYLAKAREVADRAAARLMVHIGDTAEDLPQILRFMRPGDIVSHILTPARHGVLDSDGRLLPEVREAQESGIIFDSAHGRLHFSFSFAERVLDQGLLPHIISSDLTRQSLSGPVFDLCTTMDKFLVLGLSLPEVIQRVTYNPALAIARSQDLGSLRPGSPADFTLLNFEQGSFTLTDTKGETRHISRRLVPAAVGRNGQVIDLRSVQGESFRH